MSSKLTAVTAAFAALLTLAPVAAFAHERGPAYTPPAPGYHPAAPVYVPTVARPEYRHDWQRERCEAFDRRQAQERAQFSARWGWNRNRMARFEERQARERADFYREQARNDRGYDRHDRHDRHG